jgi:uncharacterized cofD-like protein
MIKEHKVVVIGGGTGTFVVLSGLKKYIKDLVAIVSMADSGGCNRRIRDEFGLLPTSDIRQCFVALASGTNETEKIMRQLFIYRFNKGNGLKGMTFGNLFMAALADIMGSQYEAIKKTGEVLRISGAVVPVTLDNIDLVAQYENNEIIKGEHYIDEPPPKHDCKLKITEMWTDPKSKASPEALVQIRKAKLIILGPGDLYTSIIANLVVGGVAQAIQKSSAKIIYIVNLMTKPGQTFNLKASDHVSEISKYIKRSPDFIILNNKMIPPLIKKHYWNLEKSMPVEDDFQRRKSNGYQIVRRDLLSKQLYQKESSDALKRSLIRHDSSKLAKVIVSLLK